MRKQTEFNCDSSLVSMHRPSRSDPGLVTFTICVLLIIDFHFEPRASAACTFSLSSFLEGKVESSITPTIPILMAGRIGDWSGVGGPGIVLEPKNRHLPSSGAI